MAPRKKKAAHLKLTKAQHRALIRALKGGDLGDVQGLEDVKLFVEPGDFGGEGIWDDLKSVVAKAQKIPFVRDLEKKAVHKGSELLQSFAEDHADGIKDTVSHVTGMPSSVVDAAVDSGVSSIAGKAEKYIDGKIDSAGSGIVRYMSPAGGGMRRAGAYTQSGLGLRLSGQGHACCGQGAGLRLAGGKLTAGHTFPAYPLERGLA